MKRLCVLYPCVSIGMSCVISVGSCSLDNFLIVCLIMEGRR